jgi:tetratricopeptide (TPR) repeat protein
LFMLFLFCLYFVISPIIAEKLFTSASRDFSLGRFDQALRSVDRAKSFLPINPKFFELSAEIKNAKGLTDEAISAYDHALALKSDYAFYHARRGQLYRQKKMYARAFVEFEKAIALDRYGVCYHEHYSDLGSLYKESGDLKNAIVQFKAALLIEPKLACEFNWDGADYLDAILNQTHQDYLMLKYKNPLAASQILLVLNYSQRCKSVNNNM